MKHISLVLCALLLTLCVRAVAKSEDAGMKVIAAPPAAVTPQVIVDKSTLGADALTKEVIDAAKARRWFALSAAAVWLFMFFFKLTRDKWFPKLQRRWLYIIVGALSVLAMLLSRFQDDLSWAAAISVLASGPAVAYLNDLVKRGILNKAMEG